MTGVERTSLGEVVASADESLRSHAVAEPGAGELEPRVPDEDRAPRDPLPGGPDEHLAG